MCLGVVQASRGYVRTYENTDKTIPIDNYASQRAHEALGFEIANRCMHFRKAIWSLMTRWI